MDGPWQQYAPAASASPPAAPPDGTAPAAPAAGTAPWLAYQPAATPAAPAATPAAAPAAGPVEASATAPPAAPATASPSDPITTRANILPLGVTASGHMVMAVPQALVGPFQTIHDLTTGARGIGQVSPQEILDLGMVLGGLGPGTQFLKAGIPAVSETAAAATRLGITAPRAVTSGDPLVRFGTKITSSTPIAGAPEQKAAQSALDQLGEVATATKDNVGTGNVPAAGATVQQAVTDFAGPKGTLSDTVSAAYDRVDSMIDPNATAALPQTATVAQQITNARQAAGAAPSKAVQQILDAVTRPEGLTYAGITKLRTLVGEQISNPIAGSDTSNTELKQIYGALTQDTRNVIQQTGSDAAVQAWDAATAEASKASQVRADLQKIVGGPNANLSEDAIFGKLTAMTGSTSRGDVNTLNQARLAVGDNWNTVLSAMINKWGFDQNGAFNPKQFGAQWNKITPDAKQVLFQGADGKQLRSALNDIATVSAKASDLKAVADPRAMRGIIGVLGIGGATALVHLVANPLADVIPIVGSYGLSRILAKPEGAAAIATWAKAYQTASANPGTIGGTLGHAANALAIVIGADQGLDARTQGDVATRLASPDQSILALRQFMQGKQEAEQANAAAGRY